MKKEKKRQIKKEDEEEKEEGEKIKFIYTFFEHKFIKYNKFTIIHEY